MFSYFLTRFCLSAYAATLTIRCCLIIYAGYAIFHVDRSLSRLHDVIAATLPCLRHFRRYYYAFSRRRAFSAEGRRYF